MEDLIAKFDRIYDSLSVSKKNEIFENIDNQNISGPSYDEYLKTLKNSLFKDVEWCIKAFSNTAELADYAQIWMFSNENHDRLPFKFDSFIKSDFISLSTNSDNYDPTGNKFALAA